MQTLWPRAVFNEEIHLMKKRILPIVALGVTASLGLAGCAGGASDNNNGADGEGQTLNVWIMKGTNPDATAFYDEVSKAFEEETGAKVEIEEVQWADAHDRFVTAIAGGTTPDVAETGTTWTAEAYLKASGVPFVLLRNGWYAENYDSAVASALQHKAVLGSAGLYHPGSRAGPTVPLQKRELGCGCTGLLRRPFFPCGRGGSLYTKEQMNPGLA